MMFLIFIIIGILLFFTGSPILGIVSIVIANFLVSDFYVDYHF